MTVTHPRAVMNRLWWRLVDESATDCTVTAFAIFTGDSKHSFYSKPSIASLRDKLFHLRDMHMPGQRMSVVTVWHPEDSESQDLATDNLEKQFRDRIVYHRRAVYYVCLIKD